jgi:hypothetical protein
VLQLEHDSERPSLEEEKVSIDADCDLVIESDGECPNLILAWFALEEPTSVDDERRERVGEKYA